VIAERVEEPRARIEALARARHKGAERAPASPLKAPKPIAPSPRSVAHEMRPEPGG
jgi:hypothetical protein